MELDVIYNEDCLEGMKRIPDKSVDLVVIDPPYQIVAGGSGGVFGANKSYFAEYNKGDFVIKYTYPEVYAPQIGEIVSYSKTLVDELHSGENSIQPCLKEQQ